jgi:hypothetical protein
MGKNRLILQNVIHVAIALLLPRNNKMLNQKSIHPYLATAAYAIGGY